MGIRVHCPLRPSSPVAGRLRPSAFRPREAHSELSPDESRTALRKKTHPPVGTERRTRNYDTTKYAAKKSIALYPRLYRSNYAPVSQSCIFYRSCYEFINRIHRNVWNASWISIVLNGLILMRQCSWVAESFCM